MEHQDEAGNVQSSQRQRIQRDKLRTNGTLVRKSAWERMIDKVVIEEHPDGCWLFKGAIDDFGHGNVRVKINGKWTTRKAHQVAYERYHGALPEPPACIRHWCDVPNCVSEYHLIPGSKSENNFDMYARNRRKRSIR